MISDIFQKRGAFIGKINSLMQEFHYANPNVLLNLVQSYACNIYGSNIWNLFSPACGRLYTSYNVALRSILKLPCQTHRYLLEPLTDAPHLYVSLLARYVTFVHSLLDNQSFEVRFLAHLSTKDMRTVVGQNIQKIATLCNVDNDISSLSAKIVKKNIH